MMGAWERDGGWVWRGGHSMRKRNHEAPRAAGNQPMMFLFLLSPVCHHSL